MNVLAYVGLGILGAGVAHRLTLPPKTAMSSDERLANNALDTALIGGFPQPGLKRCLCTRPDFTPAPTSTRSPLWSPASDGPRAIHPLHPHS